MKHLAAPMTTLLVTLALPCVAATAPPAAPKQRTYQALRFEEDWSWLAKTPPATKDAFDEVKWHPLGGAWHLTLGGSSRARAEADWNKTLGASPHENDTLGRLRGFVDLDIGHARDFRWFAEIRAADTCGSSRPKPALFQDAIDMNDFFLEGTFASATKHPVAVRAGRQELLFGQEKLVSPLDWSGTHRTFDGLSVIASTPRTKTTVFVTHPVAHQPHEIDKAISNVDFFGVNASLRLEPGQLLETYAFGKYDNNHAYAAEDGATMGSLRCRTYGAHYQLDVKSGWSLDTEWALQDGSVSTDSIRAFIGSVTGGHQWAKSPWKPKISLGLDEASGDSNPADGTRGTFDQLFPLSHRYFGHMDLVARQNVKAARVQVETFPRKGLKWETQLHGFRLASNRDALYDATGKVVRRDATGASGGDVAVEIDSIVTFAWKTHHWVGFEVCHWWSGDFISATGSGKDATYVWAGYEFKF